MGRTPGGSTARRLRGPTSPPYPRRVPRPGGRATSSASTAGAAFRRSPPATVCGVAAPTSSALEAAGLKDGRAALFQSVDRVGDRLTGRSLTRRVILAMIKRRAATAGLPPSASSERRRVASLVAGPAEAPVSVARPRPRPKGTTAPGKPAPCVSRASPDPGPWTGSTRCRRG